MPVSSTAAGMKNYVPRRPDKTIDDIITPEIRAKRAKMIDDARLDEAEKANQSAAASVKPAMKKGGVVKTRRFMEGGGTSVDEDPIGGVADFESQNSPESKADTEEKPKSFKVAFAEARASGDKTFEWNGKKYSTALAGENTSTSKSMPSTIEKAYSTEGRGKDVVSKPRYQSLQDRAEEYASKRKESGIGMYGNKKANSEPRESRKTLDFAKADLKGPFTGMGTDYKPKMRGGESFAKGGLVRGGGIEQRGKTRGRMC